MFQLFIFISCKKVEDTHEENEAGRDSELIVAASADFRYSGLEAVIIPDFEEQSGVQVKIRLFEDQTALDEALRDEDQHFDLALGLSSDFYRFFDQESLFRIYESPKTKRIPREVIFERQTRYIPYAQSYLAVVYNAKLITHPPSSFGQLQDDIYFGKIAVIEPDTDEIGKAVEAWCFKLFGEAGSAQMQRAMRKNIYRRYDKAEDAINVVKKGEAALVIANARMPEYLQEVENNNILGSKAFSEGRYFFSKGAAITKNSKNPERAEELIEYLLDESAQRMVVYKTTLSGVF